MSRLNTYDAKWSWRGTFCNPGWTKETRRETKFWRKTAVRWAAYALSSITTTPRAGRQTPGCQNPATFTIATWKEKKNAIPGTGHVQNASRWSCVYLAWVWCHLGAGGMPAMLYLLQQRKRTLNGKSFPRERRSSRTRLKNNLFPCLYLWLRLQGRDESERGIKCDLMAACYSSEACSSAQNIQ